METTIQLDLGVQKLFIFEEVYPARAAQEQAEKRKLGAFGKLARLNPLNRPKPETVSLAKWELRYEPFWHVEARREVSYLRQAVYQVAVTNPHAVKVAVSGETFEIAQAGNKRRFDLPVEEACRRDIDLSLYVDGLKRITKQSALQSFIARYRAVEADALERTEAVINHVPLASLLEIVKARLTNEAIDAHQITSDQIRFQSLHLYYRPVFAFEFAWGASNRIGVIEIDGLTGEVVEEGQWLREKIDQVMTRDTLFDLGAEVAAAVVPGGGVAVKLVGKVTQPRSGE